MTLLLILVGTAMLALLAAWKALRGHLLQADTEELMRQIRQVDMRAFRNLIDRGNEEYLRQHISPKDFRAWQRLRAKAALEYLSWISRNAVVLLSIGERAARNSDLAIASRGRHLANVALLLRINCVFAMAKVYVGLIYPPARVSINSVADRYAKTHDSFVSLRFVQQPASISKALATL